MITKHFIIRHSVIIYILSNISACSLGYKAGVYENIPYERVGDNNNSRQSHAAQYNNSDNSDSETARLIPSQQTTGILTGKEKYQIKHITLWAVIGAVAGTVVAGPVGTIAGLTTTAWTSAFATNQIYDNKEKKPQQVEQKKQD